MLDNISDLMLEIEKFKGTVVSSEKLVNELETTTKRIEETCQRVEDTRQQMTRLQKEYSDLVKANQNNFATIGNLLDSFGKKLNEIDKRTTNSMDDLRQRVSSVSVSLKEKMNKFSGTILLLLEIAIIIFQFVLLLK